MGSSVDSAFHCFGCRLESIARLKARFSSVNAPTLSFTGLTFRVSGFGFRVSGFMFRVSGKDCNDLLPFGLDSGPLSMKPNSTLDGNAATHRPHSSSFWGSYLESYKVIPKRNYYGA